MLKNSCTAGGLTDGLDELVEFGSVVQRDMKLRAFGFPLSTTPFDPEHDEITLSETVVVCETREDFLLSTPEITCDIVHIALDAIAKIAVREGILLQEFKYIFDKADERAPADLNENLGATADCSPDTLKTIDFDSYPSLSLTSFIDAPSM